MNKRLKEAIKVIQEECQDGHCIDCPLRKFFDVYSCDICSFDIDEVGEPDD